MIMLDRACATLGTTLAGKEAVVIGRAMSKAKEVGVDLAKEVQPHLDAVDRQIAQLKSKIGSEGSDADRP